MEQEMLKAYGIDYEEGLARCASDPAFYKMLLAMFLNDKSFPRAKAAYESGDDKALFSGMHELKGVSGTASLTELYDAVCPFVELLRSDGAIDPSEKARCFAAVEAAYRRAYEGISRFAG